MRNLFTRRSGTAAVLATALAALIIGCGGGGGGGGGNGGSSGNTNNSGNTSADSGSTDSGVTIAGEASAGGTGVLVPNSIYFVQTGQNGTYDVKYTTEPTTGGGPVPPTTYATGLDANYPVAAPDPSAAGQIFFAFAPSGTTYGIYRGTNPASSTGAQTIVNAQYSFISSIQPSRDGTKVIYVAQPTGDTTGAHLYYANVGTTPSTPVKVDGNEVLTADVSPLGGKIVYSRVTSTGVSLYTYEFASNSTGLLIGNSGTITERVEPQFSKGGPSRVVYSVAANQAARHVIEFITPSGTTAQIDPFPGTDVSLRSPSYNSDGTRIAFTAESDTDPTKRGVYTIDVLGQDLVKVVDGDVLPAIYWSTATGRSVGGGVQVHLNLPHKR